MSFYWFFIFWRKGKERSGIINRFVYVMKIKIPRLLKIINYPIK